ncbi:hypothetical protein ACHAPJ_007174 [Fusarium lateritium]
MAQPCFQVLKNDEGKIEMKTDQLSDLSKADGAYHPDDRGPEGKGSEAGQVTPKHKNFWKPGRLLGCDIATIKAEMSDPEYEFILPSQMDHDLLSVTCRGHVQQHPRPSKIGVEWGGYDRFRGWQLHSRQVKKDMVEKGNFKWDLHPVVE